MECNAEHYQRNMPNLANSSEWKDCFDDDMEWFAAIVLILRQSYHSATHFNHVLLQLVDILNTLFKYWVSYRQLRTFITQTLKNRWRKAVQSFICYLWIFNTQLHVHLKNWTLKFELLHLLNHINNFNKIGRICCVNTHIQILKVSLKSVLDSGVTIGHARRAVHAGPALWGPKICPTLFFLKFFWGRGGPFGILACRPLQPCYATRLA